MRKIILSLSLLLASSAAFAQSGFIYPDRPSAYSACITFARSIDRQVIPGMNTGFIACYVENNNTACLQLLTQGVAPSGAAPGVLQHRVSTMPAYSTVANNCSSPSSSITYQNTGLNGAEWASFLQGALPHWATNNQQAIDFRFNDSSCSNRPPTTNLRHPGPNGTGTVCDLGCQLVIAASANTSTGVVTWEGEYNNQTCEAGQFPEPITYDPTQPQDTDGDGIPDISDPCPLDIYNECSGTLEPTNPNAPPNTAGGGQGCQSPPVCSGDSVQCSILYQAWAQRCESQPVEFDDSNIVDAINNLRESSNPLLQQIADNTANLNNSSPGGGVSPADSQNLATTATATSEIANQLATDGVDPDWEGVEDLAQLTGQVEFTTDMLDDSGMGFPRTCPTWQDINFSLGGSPIMIPLSNFTVHCTIFTWVGYLLVAMAAFYASQILIRG